MTGLAFGFPALEAEFWRWVFLMTRVGAALAAAPLFGGATVPGQVRVIAAAAIAALVAGATHVAIPAHLLSLGGIVAVLGEVLIGLMLGFVLQCAFTAPMIAAEVIGGGMGMGLAATIDPQNGTRVPVFGQYFTSLLTLVFFAIGGHLQWLALVVTSYSAIPPGAVLAPAGIGAGQFLGVLSFATVMFATAVTIALPISLVLLITQVLTGIVSRAAPALNLFALGLPAAIVAGIAALIAGLPLITADMATLTTTAIGAASPLIVPGAR